jgi:hypothetical protein
VKTGALAVKFVQLVGHRDFFAEKRALAEAVADRVNARVRNEEKGRSPESTIESDQPGKLEGVRELKNAFG